MSISDERLAELIGLGCDGIARHEACALATEVQGLRAALSRRSLDTAVGVDAADWLLAAQSFLGADDFAAMRSLAEAFAKDRQAGVNSQLKSAGQS